MRANDPQQANRILDTLQRLKGQLAESAESAESAASERVHELFNELSALGAGEPLLVLSEATPPCIAVLALLVRDGSGISQNLAVILSEVVTLVEADVIDAGKASADSSEVPADFREDCDRILKKLLLHVVDEAGIGDLPSDDTPGARHDIGNEITSMQKMLDAPPPTDVAANDAAPATAQQDPTKKKKKRSRAGAQNEGKEEKAAITRVKTKLLEELVGHAEELIQVKNTLHEICSRLGDDTLFEVTRRLDIIATSVMDDLLRTRMRPVSILFSSFTRIVRDLSRDLDKKIKLKLIGENVELDESVIEAIREPLVHLVRNSADHGIEDSATRVEANKSETGTLTLHPYNEPGTVVIKISDDGKGVDQDKLRKAGIKQGLVSEFAAVTMTEQEALSLLFESGLSTADSVTAVSGRGVGMGVVRSKIEALRGTVQVESEVGIGTSVFLRFPLTMATLKASVVAIGGAHYAVPMTDVSQIVRIRKQNSTKHVRFDSVGATVDLGHTTITLIEPARHLSIRCRGDSIRERYESEEGIQMIVFRHHNREWGLSVDEVVRLLDVVIKPVDPHMNSAGIFSGATVLGDGSLALVFDLAGVVDCAKVRLGELASQAESSAGEVAF